MKAESGYEEKPYIICCAALSGGQGKTTVVYFLARKLTELGLRVLIIDGDPQWNLTFYSGIEIEDDEPTLLEVLKEVVIPEDAIYDIELFGGSIIPSDNGLIAAQDFLPSTGIAALVLRNLLTGETAPRGFDAVLIDSPPQGSHIWSTCACAADGILIPAECSSKGVTSVETTISSLQTLRRRRAFNGEILGIIPFRRKRWKNADTLRSRKAITKFEQIAEEENVSLFDSIWESEQFPNATDEGKTLADLNFTDLEAPLNQIAEVIKAKAKAKRT